MFFKIPKLHESVIQIGEAGVQAERMSEGDRFQLLVWNVYKGQKQSFLKEIRQLSPRMDFLLLQEILIAQDSDHLHCPSLNKFLWQVGLSFKYRRSLKGTGVAVGSLLASSKVEIYRAETPEFYFLTPKTAIFTIYPIRNQEVLIVNCHALNFILNQEFLSSMEFLSEKMSTHRGPMIVAGDFNTWNQGRWAGLLSIFKNVGLEHVALEEDRRLLKLDHIFTRDVRIVSAKVLGETTGSDHYPLLMEFGLLGHSQPLQKS